jgi:hypothetical protein
MISDVNLSEWEADARAELSDYAPFDQAVMLGEQRWMPDDPKVIAWEAAHGHEPRLKCYAEFGCQVLEVPGARRILALIDALRGHSRSDEPGDVDLFMVDNARRMAETASMPLFATYELVVEDVPRMIAELRRRRGEKPARKTSVVGFDHPSVEAVLQFFDHVSCGCHMFSTLEKHDVNPPCSTRVAARNAYLAAIETIGATA